MVHWFDEYSQYIHFNIPMNGLVHCKLYRYMEKYIWIKLTSQLSEVCATFPLNLQVLFYYGHVSHFYDPAIEILSIHHIHAFVFKAGESVNY